MSKLIPSCCGTTNWSSYTASLRKRGSLMIWLDKEIAWLAWRYGSPGRHAVFSDTTIQVYPTVKVQCKLSWRQTTWMVAECVQISWLTELCTPGHPAPAWGVSLGRFSAFQPFLEPAQHFVLNPPHPVRAKLYPLGELTGSFQAGDVLWRVQNQLLQLAL